MAEFTVPRLFIIFGVFCIIVALSTFTSILFMVKIDNLGGNDINVNDKYHGQHSTIAIHKELEPNDAATTIGNFSAYLSVPYINRANCSNSIHPKYRIFTIGFHVCGTLSFHHFFSKHNMESIHYANKAVFRCMTNNYYYAKNQNTFVPLLSYKTSIDYGGAKCAEIDLCNGYVHYSDFGIEPIMTPLPDPQYNFLHINDKPKWYELLDKQYPYPFTRFILNIRPVNNWIESRWAHAMNRTALGGIILKRRYTQFMKRNNYTKEDVVKYWKSDWYHYICNALKYFSRRNYPHPILVLFDIETDPIAKLIQFFNRDGIHLSASKWKQTHSHTHREHTHYNATEIENIEAMCNLLTIY